MNPIPRGHRHAQSAAPSARSSHGPRSKLIGSCLALLAFSLAVVTLDAGTVTGRVVNKNTGQYLRNAVVQVVGTNRSVVTGDGGTFTIRDVPAGSQTLSIRYTGLTPAEQIVVVPETGTVNQDVELTRSIAEDDETVVLETFEVAGIREGNAAAIVQQRQAINVQTTIAADAFGDISEGNIGEFLKFLPGINVDYVDADVRAVRVRGLSPKYANVTIDGHPIATSASSSINTGRQFEFEQVSLATVDIVEINKSPTADQIAGGMAGNVNVRSKSAFNQRGRQIKYNLNMNINEFGDGIGESIGWDDTEHNKGLIGGSIEFSDTFMEDRLGVVAAFNHSGSYVRQLVLIGSQDFDNNPDNNKTEVPSVRSWNFQDGPKPTWRDAAVLNLDFRASENLLLSWNNSYNWYKAPFHNRNWVISSPATTWTNNTFDTGRTTPPNATSTAHTAQTQGSNLRKSGGTFITTPGFSWEASDRLTVDGSVSYSRSYNDYNSGDLGFFSQATARMNGVAWEYELDGENEITIRQLNLPGANTNEMLLLGSYTDNLVVNNEERHSVDQFWTANLDFTLRNDQWQKPTTFKFGADYRLNVRDIENFNPSWRMNLTGSRGPALNLEDHNDPIRPHIRQDETIIGISGTTARPPSLSEWSLFEEFTNWNMDPFASTANTAANGTTITTVSQPFYNTIGNVGANVRNKLQNHFDIEEKVYSAYGMATVDLSDDMQAIFGLRYESTDTSGRSFLDIGDQAAQAAAPLPTGYPGGIGQWRNNPTYVIARYGGRRELSKSYDSFLPSAQVRYEASENLVLRGAYFRSLLRPDFSNVVGGVTVNDAGDAFTVRNFELEPEYANNFDARVEYYFEPVGVVSFGVFYKDISDIQINVPVDYNTVDELPQSVRDAFSPTGAGPFRVTQRINAGSASLWGAEFDYSQQLSFLPDPWSGLGVFFNASYISPDDEDILALTAEDGIAKHTFNTGFSFKKGRFDGRISANIVGERLRGVSGVSVSADGTVTPGTGTNSYRKEYLEARTQFDVNLNYELTRYATLFCNISNLTNVEQFRYNETEQNLTRWGFYGRRLTVGIKGSF